MKTKFFQILCILFVLLGISSASFGVGDILLGQAGRPLYTLTVTGSGLGTGTITSNLYGINCTSTVGVESGTCTTLVPMGTTIVLTATGDASSVFTGWTTTCTGISTCSVLINGNRAADAEFTAMPLSDYLIGWYRFTEGSGTTVLNYASGGLLGGGLLPNLTVANQNGNFWTFLVGFGSTPLRDDATNNYAYCNFGARVYGGAVNGYNTQSFFWRLNPAVPNVGAVTFYNINTVELEAVYNNIGPALQDNRYSFGGFSTLPNISPFVGGEWLFYYVTNARRLARVRTDGTRELGGVSPMDPSINSIWVMVGVECADIPGTVACNTSTAFGSMGSYGDAIIYNFTQLSDTQWKTIYNQLRGRYGMAAPNGW